MLTGAMVGRIIVLRASVVAGICPLNVSVVVIDAFKET